MCSFGDPFLRQHLATRTFYGDGNWPADKASAAVASLTVIIPRITALHCGDLEFCFGGLMSLCFFIQLVPFVPGESEGPWDPFY